MPETYICGVRSFLMNHAGGYLRCKLIVQGQANGMVDTGDVRSVRDQVKDLLVEAKGRVKV